MTNPSGVAALEEENGPKGRKHIEAFGLLINTSETVRRLARLVNNISQSGDPDRPFFYLGGPMTGIDGHNFPRFREVGSKLRAKGYNIISPAELDDPETAEKYAQSDGSPLPQAEYGGLLGRDLIVVALPTCVGMVVIEDWEHSHGVAGETWVCGYLKKQLLSYSENDKGEPILTSIERDKELDVLLEDPLYVAGRLPGQKPGEATMRARAESAVAGLGLDERRDPLDLEPLGPMWARS